MPAELRLHRLRRELALRRLHHRVAERLYETRRRIPVQVATLVFRPRIFRPRLGEVVELGAFLQLGDDFLRLVFFLDEDMADVVFLVADLRLDLFVLALELGFGNRILLDPIGDIGAHQHRLAGEIHLRLHVGRLVEPLLARLAG